MLARLSNASAVSLPSVMVFNTLSPISLSDSHVVSTDVSRAVHVAGPEISRGLIDRP